MELQSARLLAVRMIEKDEKHPDYGRTVLLADKYKKIITGEDIGSLLMQFIQREDAEMFAQRVRMTQSITPAVCAAIMTPFSKVTRNRKITKSLGIQEERRKALVDQMMTGFYGNKNKKNSGLDGFMGSRFRDLTFTDPNAWVVVEWTAAPISQAVQPKPFIVPSREAIHFNVENEAVNWLFVRQPITYPTQRKLGPNGYEVVSTDGYRFTLYDSDYTVVLEEAKAEYVNKYGTLQPGEELLELANGKAYIYRVFQPKLGFPPAFRVGYEADLETEGRTYVNPFHPAMGYLMKSIKTVSELDLTMTLHTFPQKFQYVNKCPGESKARDCKGGMIDDGTKCKTCGGKGYKVHSTAQDVVLLPMPDVDDAKSMVPLSSLIHYAAPPADIINIQLQYAKDLKQDAMMAVFNSQTFVQATIAKTATEQQINMESVYDKLSPFADKYSELWKEIVSVIVALSGLRLDGVAITHAFPADLKLKTTSMLVADLVMVNEGQAPSFMRDEINKDIAETLYSDDPQAMKKWEVKARFYPFGGRSADDIALAVASAYVTRFDKVLYFNFEKIFAEIDRDQLDFWEQDYAKQWAVIGEKVNAIIADIGEAEADRFSVTDLTGVNATQKNQQQSTKPTPGENPPA